MIPTTRSFHSGPPWHLHLTLDRIGADYLCRIHGGEAHIGAVTLSQWHPEGARTHSLVVDGHKEAPIAEHVAHILCRTARENVTCVAGIHFDGIDAEQIEDIVRTAKELSHQVAKEIEESSP